jgi:MFS family permease
MILWITLKLTGIPVIAGLADGLYTAPLFLSFFVGTFVDRSRHKKAVAVLSAVSKSLAILLLYLAIEVNYLYTTVFLIFLCVLALGFTSDINNAVRSSWTKSFLKEEEYQKGTSKLNSLESLAQMVGYTLSGAFLYLGDVRGITALILIFVLAIFPILLIKERPSKTDQRSEANGFREGLSFLRSSRILQEVIFIGMIVNLALSMLGIGFTILIQTDLKLPAFYFSLAFISIAVGVIAGSLISSKARGKLGLIVILSLALIALSLFSISFIGIIYIIYVPAFLVGFGVGVVNTPAQTVLLKRIPENMIARSMGLFNTLALSMTFLSGTIGGLIVQLSSIKVLFIFMGAMMVAGAISVQFLRELRGAVIS